MSITHLEDTQIWEWDGGRSFLFHQDKKSHSLKFHSQPWTFDSAPRKFIPLIIHSSSIVDHLPSCISRDLSSHTNNADRFPLATGWDHCRRHTITLHYVPSASFRRWGSPNYEDELRQNLRRDPRHNSHKGDPTSQLMWVDHIYVVFETIHLSIYNFTIHINQSFHTIFPSWW